jgi:uncharacterized protein (DUF486 family)
LQPAKVGTSRALHAVADQCGLCTAKGPTFAGVFQRLFMKGALTILLLLISNVFMTFAWYGHLKFQELAFFKKTGVLGVIIASWLIAFLEYCFMVPANRIGYVGNGGPFSLLHLKVIQEIVTLVVFVGFSLFFFKSEMLRWNHYVGFLLLVLAVYFIRK